MTDERETQPGKEAARDLPPIPDGGLASAMPAWLRQPPAWKQEPVRMPDLPKTLPPPDDSPIDPAHLIDVDDLPGWLQDLARASERSTTIAALADEPPAGIAPTVAEPAAGPGALSGEVVEDDNEQVEAVTDASPPVEPVSVHAERHTDVVSRPVVSPPLVERSTPWWLSDGMLAAIVVGIVLTMIYVILAASGVV